MSTRTSSAAQSGRERVLPSLGGDYNGVPTAELETVHGEGEALRALRGRARCCMRSVLGWRDDIQQPGSFLVIGIECAGANCANCSSRWFTSKCFAIADARGCKCLLIEISVNVSGFYLEIAFKVS